MAYTPVNIQIFAAAYSGAIAAFGASSYAGSAVQPFSAEGNVALAFAQAVDTAWNSAVIPSTFDVEATYLASLVLMRDRGPFPSSTQLTSVSNWTASANQIVGSVLAGEVTASAAGITFPTVSTSSNAQSRYVSKGGNDTSGDGSFTNPFLTVQAAINSIGDASNTKPYGVFVAPGIYAGTFTLKPGVFVVGSGSDETSLAPVATNCLGTGFTGAGTLSSGISNATITTNLVADFSAIGSTGAGKVFFQNLVLAGTLVLTGAANPAANYALLNNISWIQFVFKNMTITNMSNVDMFSVRNQFAALAINADDTAFRDVQGFGCYGFGTLTITWTGAAANANNAIDVIFDTSPQIGSTGGGGSGQPVVTGLGAIYSCTNGIKLTVAVADTAIQFNRFLGAGSVGVAGDVIGCDAGTNHITCAPVADMTLTLRKPTNGTWVKIKNQSAFNVNLNFNGLGVSGPSYVGPLGYMEMFFTSGTWNMEELVQSGVFTLVNGVTAAPIPADLSASTQFAFGLVSANGARGVIGVLAADRTNGAKGTGQFTPRSLDTANGTVNTDNGTYSWVAFPGK